MSNCIFCLFLSVHQLSSNVETIMCQKNTVSVDLFLSIFNSSYAISTIFNIELST